MHRLSLVFALQGLAAAACAADNVTALREIAKQPQWRALLHFPRGGERSYIDDRRFFLAERGDRDPLAELLATVEAFAERPALRCRYPARALWLLQQGLIVDVKMSCKAYRRWRDQLDTQSVVLVLASSYLNSPSSMYGHTFLRLDPAGARGDSDFLSYALNFGANIPAGENDLLYAYRGLFGGYPGLFSVQPYYQKIQEYTRLENRDMWEYRLNLNAAEIDRLLRHVWELRDINFDYFFIDENCSYRLLELLEVARPGVELPRYFRYAAIPADTVRAAVDASMLSSVTYRPAKRLELEALVVSLPEAQRPLVRRLSSGELQDLSAEQLAADQQARVYLAAYRDLRYRQHRQARDAEIAARSLRLLRGARQGSDNQLPQVAAPGRPDRGHRSSLFAVSAGYRESGERRALANAAVEYADFRWRMSYHDALDSLAGYPQGASLLMGDLTLRWQDRESLRLQAFELLNIRSLSPRSRLFSPISWQVQLGLERLDDAPSQPLVARLNVAAGPSWSLLGGVAYTLPELRLEHNRDFDQDWRLAPGLRSGMLWQGERLALELSAELLDFSAAGQRIHYRAEGHYQQSTNRALRLAIDHRDQPWGVSTGVELSWRHYF